MAAGSGEQGLRERPQQEPRCGQEVHLLPASAREKAGASSTSKGLPLSERPQTYCFSCPVSLERLAAKEEKGFRACLLDKKKIQNVGNSTHVLPKGAGGRSQERGRRKGLTGTKAGGEEEARSSIRAERICSGTWKSKDPLPKQTTASLLCQPLRVSLRRVPHQPAASRALAPRSLLTQPILPVCLSPSARPSVFRGHVPAPLRLCLALPSSSLLLI